jgi:NAD(P)H dehydrogenase (quinone)
MKILIVYAHPEPKSFNGAMKNLAVEVLTEGGHEVMVSDLYGMNFDPRGGPIDFTTLAHPEYFHYQREQIDALANRRFEPMLQAEMDKLVWADLVIFQFPLWWFSLPAILKGWVDRIFAMGFAYDIRRSHEAGVFRGKRGMLAFTTGAPAVSYVPGGRNGDLHELLYHVQYGQLHFIGMDVLPPFVAYGASRAPEEVRAQYLADYRARLMAIEETAPIDFSRAAQAT